MKNIYASLLVVLMYSIVSHSSFAQSERKAFVPLPSLDDFTMGEDGLALGLGVSVEYESAYEGSDEFGFEVGPAGALQWRNGKSIFYWAGEALGWRGNYFEKWLFEAIVGMEEGREESDSDKGRLNGLGNQKESVEFALQARRAFDTDWRYWIDARLVTGKNGSLGLLAIGRRFGDQTDGTGHEVSIAAVFHESDYANNSFGVTASQSLASGLAETRLDGGFRSIGFNYNYRQYIAQSWQIFGEAVYEGYSGEIKDSPIVRGDFEAEIGLGVIYIF